MVVCVSGMGSNKLFALSSCDSTRKNSMGILSCPSILQKITFLTPYCFRPANAISAYACRGGSVGGIEGWGIGE